MDKVSWLASAVKEKKSIVIPALASSFSVTDHILDLTQRIKDNENPCINLVITAAELVLGIEKKSPAARNPALYEVNSSPLEILSGTLEQIHTLVFRAVTSLHLMPFVNYDIARLHQQLEEEAAMFEVPSESLTPCNVSKPSGAEIQDFLNEIKSVSSEASDPGSWDAYNIRTFIVSMGVRDLTRHIRILGDKPAARGTHCLIWSGLLLDNSQVAMKLLDLSVVSKVSIRHFIHDAIIWSYSRHHENVLPLLGVVQLRDSVALISPWMEFGSLRECIETYPEVPTEPLIADVARGIAYLHSRGIAYGNLRPSTVVVSSMGRAYLSSFLMAEFYQEIRLPEHSQLYRKYGITATPESDVLAFGNLILQPFRARSKNLGQMLHRVTQGNNRLAGNSEDDLWQLIRRCMDNVPGRRPTMSEIACIVVPIAEASFSGPSNCSTHSTPSGPLETLKDISEEITKRDEHPITGGGASDLYLGERKGEKVALKLIRFFGSSASDQDSARRRFTHEACLWAGFHHPRILEFYGICNHGAGALFMVTPFLENGTITDYLSKVNPSVNRITLLSQTAEGLLYLHSRHPPVVHGDLKSSNVLITNSGTAVLADFGLSKPNNEKTTTMLQGMGSPRWMAPELLKVGNTSDGPVKTQKSDIYAYGHVILEVLSNKLPFFHLKDDIHVIVEIINGGRSPRPDGPVAEAWLNDSAWKLSQECTTIDPEGRPIVNTVVRRLYSLSESRRLI